MTSLLPRPLASSAGEGSFVLDATTSIAAPEELVGVVARLQEWLRPATGLPLRESAEGDIRLSIDAELGPEGYHLVVAPEGVSLAGGDERGVLWGCQALRQLLPAAGFRRARVDGIDWTIDAIEIEDRPAFAWRGAMLDPVRHFLPKHDVLRFVDLMAGLRLNTLHFHLTDDQGWRIQIHAFPKLTELASWRTGSQVGAGEDAPDDGRPHGGFYTQDDLREIVAYAADRGITVVPEVETPGHAQAALAAYPELGVTGERTEVWTRWGVSENVFNAEDSTIDFFRTVLDEVMAIFPSRYIGVGGDECPKVQWQADPRTQELMLERGLATEEDLQAWFIRRLDDHVSAAGRRILGWDEILEGDLGLAASATVLSWRGMTGAITAARAGHDVVSCPDDHAYLDYRQSDDPDEPIPVAIPITVDDAYAFDPVPPELTSDEAAHILGGQANLWSEHLDSPRRLDYQAFPRLAAIAEALWSADAGTGRDAADFAARLDEHLERLDAIGVEYRHADGPRPWERIPGVAGRPATREEQTAWRDEITANIAR